MSWFSKKSPEEIEVKDLESQASDLKKQITNLESTKDKLTKEVDSLNEQVIVLSDEALYQDFGLYEPMFNFANLDTYKLRLDGVRDQEKAMIKKDTACVYSKNFTLNNSKAKGLKLVKDNVKQIIRTFNNECDTLIDKAKFNNIESIEKRILKSREQLEKLNQAMEIRFTQNYVNLKLEELRLSYEFAKKKEEEKEAAREHREALREEAKLKKEIEEARKKSKKEQTLYLNELDKINPQLTTASGDEKLELLKKKEILENTLSDIDKAIKDIDYREANNRAGYVYIISNIGSFGKNVYKIGMTRRLEPMDRIKELGDASVPFNFDVHALIFSDDAPGLEAALHNAFEQNKVNMINQRREFFNVTLDDIEKVVRDNYDKTVDFVILPEAEQYRETVMIKKNLNK